MDKVLLQATIRGVDAWYINHARSLGVSEEWITKVSNEFSGPQLWMIIGLCHGHPEIKNEA